MKISSSLGQRVNKQRWMCISNVVGWLENETSIPTEGSIAELDKV